MRRVRPPGTAGEPPGWGWGMQHGLQRTRFAAYAVGYPLCSEDPPERPVGHLGSWRAGLGAAGHGRARHGSARLGMAWRAWRGVEGHGRLRATGWRGRLGSGGKASLLPSDRRSKTRGGDVWRFPIFPGFFPDFVPGRSSVPAAAREKAAELQEFAYGPGAPTTTTRFTVPGVPWTSPGLMESGGFCRSCC